MSPPVRRLAAVIVLLVPLVAAGSAHAASLRAGVGKADITPRTGYYLGGWTRAGPRGAGPAHAPVRAGAGAPARRPQGRARGDRPVHGPGRPREARRRRARRPRLLRAEHARVGVAHALRAGRLRELQRRSTPPRRASSTATDPLSFYRLLDPPPADRSCTRSWSRQMRRDPPRGRGPRPAERVGLAEIHGLTQNRSIEAHLANHGIRARAREGSAAQDPERVDHTIDPRVERAARRQARPRAPRCRSAAGPRSRTTARSRSRASSTTTQDHHASALAGLRAARAPRRARAAARSSC